MATITAPNRFDFESSLISTHTQTHTHAHTQTHTHARIHTHTHTLPNTHFSRVVIAAVLSAFCCVIEMIFGNEVMQNIINGLRVCIYEKTQRARPAVSSPSPHMVIHLCAAPPDKERGRHPNCTSARGARLQRALELRCAALAPRLLGCCHVCPL
jgi:hypothetical protein